VPKSAVNGRSICRHCAECCLLLEAQRSAAIAILHSTRDVVLLIDMKGAACVVEPAAERLLGVVQRRSSAA
jgi:hypothetical protein